MNTPYLYCDKIDLYVKDHEIPPEDAKRQAQTAREILRRFSEQPGVILADEVGMGKTFVALAVAASVVLDPDTPKDKRQPVVVMVPPSLEDKWPRDFGVFCAKCLPPELAEQLRNKKDDERPPVIKRAEQFLKLLDDPETSKRSIIFMTHGAMSRGLTDRWVTLALIRRGLWKRWNSASLRTPLVKILPALLRMKTKAMKSEEYTPDFWFELLETDPSGWLKIMQDRHIDPEEDNDLSTDDDPVPKAVCEALPELDVDDIYECLKDVPKRDSLKFDERVETKRKTLSHLLKELWVECIRKMKYRLPLLILDEAHHLKNAKTKLAGLFQIEDAKKDAEELRGALHGVFERILFLTATPFQLRHEELCNVLRRFSGICWEGKHAIPDGQGAFEAKVKELQESLDKAQEAAITLDTLWGKLRPEDLTVGANKDADDKHDEHAVEKWWEAAKKNPGQCTSTARQVVEHFERTKRLMQDASMLLKPWVIRHRKPRYLSTSDKSVEKTPRRQVLPGRAICMDDEDSGKTEEGIAVSGKALLPFLLAARAAFHKDDARPVFAEGLASSYETFLHTREMNAKAQQKKKVEEPEAQAQAAQASNATVEQKDDLDPTDDDHEPTEPVEETDAARWYLEKLDETIKQDKLMSVFHPKVAATVKKVVEIWEAREKVLVFCHWIKTGDVLLHAISDAIRKRIQCLGTKKLGCPEDQVEQELERIGNPFEKKDSPLRRACAKNTREILKEFSSLRDRETDIVEIVRRYVRTPSFLVRFFPLEDKKLSADAVDKVINPADESPASLGAVLRGFFRFLDRCEENNQGEYIKALRTVQTGGRNTRLSNGTTDSDTRRRLMLTFNTPFFPEVLIASSVMAEGVDLHLNCRYVIHHDLCWNPSTLEQRTGRIDRIGAKVEKVGKPIQVYLPYVAETQDEKMYRVVMDRQRWFSIVMGEKYKTDVRSTEKGANRILLPESAVKDLAFQLQVVESEHQGERPVE